ncbi:MAG: acyltransferase family protein, partial [Lachnospiraceae bacterium]|nr:acyltransferase family protein [Lachnospiraceae bacterium]
MWSKNLSSKSNREVWLDIAKFFGIALVVLNHMNISIPLVTFFGGMFYMPVFFVASGYTYRNKGENFNTFAIGKAKRLLVPYAVCNVFLFLFFTVLNGKFSKPSFLGMFYSRSMMMRATSEWNMALMSNLNAPTWFLTCIFLCLCIYFLIDRKFTDARKRRLAVIAAMAVGVVLRKVSPVLLPWSIENALFFTGMIEAGRFLKEEGLAWLRKNEWIYVNILILFVALSYIQGTVNVSISEYGRSMVLYFFTGTLGSILCMKAAELTEKYLKVLAKPLAFVGRHTLPILCWHLFVIE